MKDIQKRKDKRGVPIKEVGVSEIFLPICISDKKNKKQQVVSKIKVGTSLSPEKRGTHMSRFLEVINKYQGYKFDITKITGMLETNGSIDLREFPKSKQILYSMDIKCPSSGFSDRMKYGNLKIIKKKDQIKFIIFDKKDYNFAKDIVKNII